MKSILLFIALILFSGITYSQNSAKIFYDVQGKGIADSAHASYYRLASFDASGKPVDSVHDYYNSGELRLKGIAITVDKDDDSKTKWVGKLLAYYRNGNMMAEDNYNKNGKMDSTCNRYYESGKIKQVIVCKNGAVVNKFYKEWDEFGNCENVFKDLFKYENNKNNWPLNTNDKHDCRIIKDTGLQMTTYTDEGILQTLDFPLEANKRFSIETVVEFEKGDNKLWHGMVWGFKDWENYYFFYINASGEYRIGDMSDGVITFFIKNGDDIAINKRKSKNFLKVSVKNGFMIFSINSKLISRQWAYAVHGTHAGFLIPNGKQQVLFKEIMIRQSSDEDNSENASGSAASGNPNGNEFKGWRGNGSGFFVDANGYLVTNYHVISGATEIEVDATVNGERIFFKAVVVASDKQNDLALLKITDDKFKPYQSLPYNFKTDISDVGADAFTLGFPAANVIGTEVKFTDGKISSKTGINGSPETYQISVPVQPGNSGGPLFDADGNIIGIVNSKIMNVAVSNVAYAIKSGYIKNFLDAQTEKIILPNDPSIASKILTDKIKILTDYVVLIKVKYKSGIDASSFTPVVYTVRVRGNAGIVNKKLVIVR